MVRVFLAEDMPGVREVIRQHFRHTEGRFHLVGEAGDGVAALDGILALSPDVAVMDLAMPGLTGLEVFRELRRRGNRTPVVICTGSDESGLEQIAGQIVQVQKPFAFARLDAAILEALAAGGDLTHR